MSRGFRSLDRSRRRLQLALGLVWLLDAALQFQPFMFRRSFATEVIAPAAQGNPAPIAHSVLWAAHVIAAHPVVWNALFAGAQLALALGLFWRPTARLAVAASIGWSLAVWWLGEGFGGVLSGEASPLMGAPGAVVLYALLALLAWPSDRRGGPPASAGPLRVGAAAAWIVLWSSEAYFALLPANDSGPALHGMLAGMGDGEPRRLASLDRSLAGLAGHPVGIAFGVMLALVALVPALPPALARPLLALALLLATLIWMAQDFGGILTGRATDPNSGPLLALLALAYWPARTRDHLGPATAGRSAQRLLATATLAIAAAAAAAGAAFAATTTASTPAAAGRAAAAHGGATIGPGPVASIYQLAGYRLELRDSPNRASKPGTIAVRLSRKGEPVRSAQVTVTLTMLDMAMGSLTASLPQTAPGRYQRPGPVLGMSGHWQIGLDVRPGNGKRLHLAVIDRIAP